MSNTESNIAQLFADAVQLHVCEEIEQMRIAYRDDIARPPEVQQIRSIVDGLLTVRPVDEIVAGSGFDLEELVRISAMLGTWLTHSRGKAGCDTTPTYSSELEQQPLFVATVGPMGKRRQHVVDRKLRATPRSPIPASAFILHDSWGPVLRGNHIQASLAAILSAAPTDTDLVRFIARKWRDDAEELNYYHIASLMTLVHLGRLSDVSKLTEFRGFNVAMIAAWDLLETSRRDAMVALAEFIDYRNQLADPAGTLVKMGVLWDAEARKLERFAESGSDSAMRALDRERKFWFDRVIRRPDSYLFTNIAQLNNGQVRRIAEAAGIDIVRGEREAEQRIRNGVEERGLSADIDMLLPIGLTAWHADVLDSFWDACDRYAAGDSQWRVALDRDVAKAYA